MKVTISHPSRGAETRTFDSARVKVGHDSGASGISLPDIPHTSVVVRLEGAHLNVRSLAGLAKVGQQSLTEGGTVTAHASADVRIGEYTLRFSTN